MFPRSFRREGPFTFIPVKVISINLVPISMNSLRTSPKSGSVGHRKPVHPAFFADVFSSPTAVDQSGQRHPATFLEHDSYDR